MMFFEQMIKTKQQVAAFLYTSYDLYESRKYRLMISLGVSGFVWFFLFSFGVFEFDYFSLPDRFFYTGVYSLFCLIIMLFNLFIVQGHVFQVKAVKDVFLLTLWMIFCIGISNFSLTTLVFKWEVFSVHTLMKNQIYTLSIGVIVTPVLILAHYNYMLKKRVGDTAKLNLNARQMKTDNPAAITFVSTYKDDDFKVKAGQVFYIQSADNYVDICYYHDDSTCHKLIRNTLTGIQETISHPSFKRCHRSFIVNMSKVTSVKGNAGGYKLLLENTAFEIPVSRKYKTDVFSFL